MNPLLDAEAALAAMGIVLILAASAGALARRRERRFGRLQSVDRTDRPGPSYRSESWRLSGRPDAIRERPDGSLVPVEVKSGRSPARGPYPSHRIQLLAYCLLLEESTGRRAPFGVLRYGDGVVWEVPFDAPGRAWLLEVRRSMDRPYRGQAAPRPAKCARCAFRGVCDRSLAGSR